ncbi:nef protein [Human immunodeficiency virus 1]|uniref:Protein Nef n=1 Tax=Human immunodeficiency virus type 1 TaxID=11676 RepID=A0A059WGK1_HV1|nr:nef protein [Human immunodeficiency virus 1]
MGGKWSKSSIVGWPQIRERMRRTPTAAERRERIRQTPTAAAAEGVGAVSRDLEKHGAITSSNFNNADCVWLEAQKEDEEEVGFPVRPQVPLRPMTYKGALDLSHFLREKGGLEGLIYSQKRQDILDLWVYHTQGYFPDWQNYTPGPGIRYPLTFGWCFKLVPLEPEEVEKASEGRIIACYTLQICMGWMTQEKEKCWYGDLIAAWHFITWPESCIRSTTRTKDC